MIPAGLEPGISALMGRVLTAGTSALEGPHHDRLDEGTKKNR